MTRIAIIGSGHTGLAVAKRLIAGGHRPVIIDVGQRLDNERRAIVERLRQQPPERWECGDLAAITENGTVYGAKPLRLAFGSAYPYGTDHAGAPIQRAEDGPAPSFAGGGFSTIWGGAILPPDPAELLDWPVRFDEFEPAFGLALEDLPYAAVQDALAARFPLYREADPPLALSAPARLLLDRLYGSRSLRDRADVAFGQARLAVRSGDPEMAAGCRYCGYCLSGCVYGAIYSAEQDLDRLRAAGALDYHRDRLVVRLEEQGDRVNVRYRDAAGMFDTATYDRVFLAAGAISSTRIILESSGSFGSAVNLKSTGGLVLPMLQIPGARFSAHGVNTLAAIFFEFKVPGVSDRWIHTQINPPNELVRKRLGFEPGGAGLRNRALALAFDHLLVAMCNFHSDFGGSYRLKLNRGGDGGPSVLDVQTEASRVFPHVARRALMRLLRLLPRIGVIPLVPFAQGMDGRPRGWHFGSSLPMRRRPAGPLETDVLGRPGGWRRVHVVDSSVLPSLPGTTIALLAMANAVRIAERVLAD